MPKFHQGRSVIISMDAEVAKDARGEHGTIDGFVGVPNMPATKVSEGEEIPGSEEAKVVYLVWLDSDRRVQAVESELSLK